MAIKATGPSLWQFCLHAGLLLGKTILHIFIYNVSNTTDVEQKNIKL